MEMCFSHQPISSLFIPTVVAVEWKKCVSCPDHQEVNSQTGLTISMKESELRRKSWMIQASPAVLPCTSDWPGTHRDLSEFMF
ncbi:rCG27333 [Rattus norvegicus]|uniref:RCG27333 n=1 Tax=Rattus norvegicus TaxID=10116 RepID=A6HLV6_RAT|nr:rCG27333 [Rattus norvegicus]